MASSMTHASCFILVLRHSQALNYTIPNQLFRASKRLKGTVSSIRPVNPIALSVSLVSLLSLIGFFHH